MDCLRALAGLTDEELSYLGVVDTIASEQVEPVAAEIDRSRAVPVGVRAVLLESGVAALGVSEDRGGGGAGPETALCAVQSLARSSGSAAMAVVALHAACAAWPGPYDAAPLALSAERWPVVADAGPAPCSLVTKVGGGATTLDGTIDGLICTAPEGPVVVIAGAGPDAVVAVVEPEPAAVVETGPGRSGLRGTPVASVEFRSARTRWTSHGSGSAAAREAGALGVGAVALGLAERAVDETIVHVHDRRQFGRPLVEFEAVRAMADDMVGRVSASAAALYAVAGVVGGCRSGPRAAGASALAASQTAVRVCLDAVQLHGGAGYMVGATVERLLRDAFSIRARAHHLALGP